MAESRRSKMTSKTSLTCFKNNDIRGIVDVDLNEEVIHQIGQAFGLYLMTNNTLSGSSVVVGRDNRFSSERYKEVFVDGLMLSGIDVIDIGVTGTEEVYFAVQDLKCLGGAQITASHNPINYNGIKLVQEGAKPLSKDTGLQKIKQLAEANFFPVAPHKGKSSLCHHRQHYVNHLLSYIKPSEIKPLKIIVNAGNGVAGNALDLIEETLKSLQVPIEFIKINHRADSSFPNGIPNPLIPENRDSTSKAVLKHKADFGVAWDGDFDRCFLFDEHGQYIESYYVVSLIAESFMLKEPNAHIIHDARLIWNTIDTVTRFGGTPHMVKAGHSLIKESMRKTDAIYGGEMSAHHYFRDFGYCDSGMIPWLLVANLLSVKQQTLSQVVKDYLSKYPSSGEINLIVDDAEAVIKGVLESYKDGRIDTTDGISVDMGEWRFNLRNSNTEPLLRLNLETRGDEKLLENKTLELTTLIQSIS